METKWLHDLFDGVASVGILGILGYVAKASRAFTKLQVGLDDIRENHLPHLQIDIRELRDQFIEHLQNHK